MKQAAIRGWCPSLYDPMRSGDGLLLRVKPRAAALSATQARAVATAGARHGNGWLQLTNRANLQIRGLTKAGVEPFTRAMLDAGLADADPGVERRRNLVVPPLLGEDPSLPAALPALVQALQAMLADPALAALPGKFGLLVEGGGPPTVEADILVRLTPAGAELRLPGAAVLARCTPADAPQAARRLAMAFLRLAAVAVPHAPLSPDGTAPSMAPASPRRMKALLRLVGAPRIFAKAGLDPLADSPAAVEPPPAPIGFRRYDGEDRGAFGIGLPFGQMTAAQFQAVADLAETFGNGGLRIAPWRAILLPGIAAGRAATLRQAVQRAGLIADPADPRLSILTCPGQAGCASGTTDTWADAAMLAACRPAHGWGQGATGQAGLLHLSGCAKGCAHPAAAPVTLVGRDGCYGLVLDGRAGDPPARSRLTLAEAAAVLGAPIPDAPTLDTLAPDKRAPDKQAQDKRARDKRAQDISSLDKPPPGQDGPWAKPMEDR